MRTAEIRKTYNGREVLHMEPMDIVPGRIYAIIGANGSGKSTFLKILAGMISADGGTVPFEGEKPEVSYLPQKPYVFRMSTGKNILLGGADRKQAEYLMTGLQLKELENEKATGLSGGEAARMSLARVLMTDCGLLLLDEPSAAMDMDSSLRAERMIREYADRTGAAVILVTHSLGQAMRLADEAVFMHEGTLCEKGPTEKLLLDPEDERTRAFLDFSEVKEYGR